MPKESRSSWLYSWGGDRRWLDLKHTNRTASAARGSFSLRKTFVTPTVPSIRMPGEAPPSAQAEPEDIILLRVRS